MKTTLKCIVEGFVTPSAFALWLMLATFLTTAALVLTLFSPQILVGPMGIYLPRSAKDTEAFATREVLQLALQTSAAERMVIIGDSVVAHAFADDQALAATMQENTGQAWDVHILTTALQTPIDEVAFAETAITQQGAVIVIGLDWERLSWTAERIIELQVKGRIGIRSDWADNELALLDETPMPYYGVYPVDNLNFFLRRAHTFVMRLLLQRPAIREIANYRNPELKTPDGLEQQRTYLVSELRKLADTSDFIALDILTRLAEQLNKRDDVMLVFFENPLNPSLLSEPDLPQIHRDHFEKLADFAKTHGDVYCQSPATHSSENFYDYTHLDEAQSQAEQRNALAACISRAFKQRTTS